MRRYLAAALLLLASAGAAYAAMSLGGGIGIPEVRSGVGTGSPVLANCLLISGTTTNCLLISGTTTNALLVK